MAYVLSQVFRIKVQNLDTITLMYSTNLSGMYFYEYLVCKDIS